MLGGLKLAVAGGLASALALGGCYAWGASWRSSSHTWERKYDNLIKQAGTVVIALREASDNPDVGWDTAPGQIIALGGSIRELKLTIRDQNAGIEAQAREAVRLRAKAAELKDIADKARAQRASALRRLSDLAISPGTREDCQQLLREANEALDIAIKEGV